MRNVHVFKADCGDCDRGGFFHEELTRQSVEVLGVQEA